MKNLYNLIILSLLALPFGAMAQVTVNSSGLLQVASPSGVSNYINVSDAGQVYSLDVQTGDLVFRPNGSTADATYSLKLTDDTNFPAKFFGRIDLGDGNLTGTLINANGDEAMWYDGTHFSWGFGGGWNRFADGVTIGNATQPVGGGLYIHKSNPRIEMQRTGTTGNSMIAVKDDAGAYVAWPMWHEGSSGRIHMNAVDDWDGLQLVLANDGTSVGIGTETPGAALHVVAGSSDPIFEGSVPFIQIRGVSETENKGIIFQNGTTPQSYVYHNGGNGNLTLFNSGSSDLVVDPQGNVGIGTNSPAYKLQVSGNVDVTGELTAASDMRLKKDIETIETAMDVVNKLHPVSYNFDVTSYPDLDLADRRKYGLLAQEVEAVLPNLVSEGAETTNAAGETIKVKSVNYMEMIPLLVRSVQELEDKLENSMDIIEEQSRQIETLMNALEAQQK